MEILKESGPELSPKTAIELGQKIFFIPNSIEALATFKKDLVFKFQVLLGFFFRANHSSSSKNHFTK